MRAARQFALAFVVGRASLTRMGCRPNPLGGRVPQTPSFLLQKTGGLKGVPPAEREAGLAREATARGKTPTRPTPHEASGHALFADRAASAKSALDPIHPSAIMERT